MNSDSPSDEEIIDSWRKNASPWTAAVRESQIGSRVLVTNQAIVDAVLSRAPRTVLDIGCGEGWLCRALEEHGIATIGVDVVPALVDQARRAGRGDYRAASYEQIAAGDLTVKVDAAVANFSLIGKESVEGIVQRAPALLEPCGSLIIQTLHPVTACGDAPYEDGWRDGSWAGFSDDFSDPAPWYFRTIPSWEELLTSNGFRILEKREPLHPNTGKPASLILIAVAV
ncbi:MAG: class I SAM-dependent methyltransferase [Gemmatimonadaceae bacterium]